MFNEKGHRPVQAELLALNENKHGHIYSELPDVKWEA
jgi:hypothetical protein